MKKIIVLTLLVSVAFISCKNEKTNKDTENTDANSEVQAPVEAAKDADAPFNVVAETSTLNWVGKKPTGAHNGTVAVKEGILAVANGNLIGGNVTFDMTSITVLDIPADDESHGKLLGHLKSDDFFAVETHPTATFAITAVDGTENVTVKGNLTIKGITKAIEFPATLKIAENSVMLSAETFKIDRTEFDIKYKSAKFFDNLKDKFINDDFEISFVINASK
jgi:polyisoprenoid-binding protein YceI